MSEVDTPVRFACKKGDTLNTFAGRRPANLHLRIEVNTLVRNVPKHKKSPESIPKSLYKSVIPFNR